MDTPKTQLYLFYLLSLLIAIFVGATTQLTSSDPTMHMLALSGRMVLLLGDSLLLYMLTGNNVHMKNSRFGAYMKQFVWFYGSVLAAIVLDFAFGLSVITMVSRGSDHIALTSQSWYWVFNIGMQLAYSLQIICSTATAANVFVGNDSSS